MQIVRDLAGYSMGRSDLVRRAMAKKKQAVMDREREIFIHGDESEGIAGAVKSGVDEKSANRIFDQMTDFAQYAFNRSHAAAYGVIAYQTAYLKCHYPAELFAATINSYKGDNDKVARYIACCDAMDIKVIKPDINVSRSEFTVSGGDIVFGLLAIKNVGSSAAAAVVEEREKKGRFKDFYDFCKRCCKLVNKRMIESMIYAGCFDSFGKTRSSLLKCYESLLAQVSDSGHAEGQISLFDMGGQGLEFEIPNSPEMDEGILLAEEKDRTGIYLSGHPLQEYKDVLGKMKTNILRINDGELNDGDVVTVGGMITDKRNLTTRNNHIMAFLELEDLTGSISVVVFPKLLQQYSPITGEGSIVEVTGKVSAETVTGAGGEEREEYSLVLERMRELKKGKILQVKMEGINKDFIDSIQKGTDTVELYVHDEGVWKKSIRSGVLVDERLKERAAELFGQDNIRSI